MSDEIAIRIQTSTRWNIDDKLGPNAGILTHNFSPARFFADQATKDKYEEVLEVGASDIEVTVGGLVSPGICMLQIIGSGAVIFGPYVTGAVVNFGTTNAIAIFRLDTSVYNLGIKRGSGDNPLSVQVKIWSD